MPYSFTSLLLVGVFFLFLFRDNMENPILIAPSNQNEFAPLK